MSTEKVGKSRTKQISVLRSSARPQADGELKNPHFPHVEEARPNDSNLHLSSKKQPS